MRNRFRSTVGTFLVALALAAVASAVHEPGTGEGDASASAAVPAAAPEGDWIDFRLKTPEGSPVSLSEFVGKKAVLLAFWATWCPHCNETVPELKTLDNGPLSDRLKLLAVDFRESGEKVSSFMDRKGIGYTVLLDPRGQVARMYGIVGIPTYVVISRGGEIVYRGNDLPADLSNHLD